MNPTIKNFLSELAALMDKYGIWIDVNDGELIAYIAAGKTRHYFHIDSGKDECNITPESIRNEIKNKEPKQ